MEHLEESGESTASIQLKTSFSFAIWIAKIGIISENTTSVKTISAVRVEESESNSQDEERAMSGVRVLVGTRKGAFVLTSDASAQSGRSVALISRAGRFTTSRARRSTRTGCMPRSRAAGLGSSSSAPAMAARRGSPSATSSHTTVYPVPTCGTTARRTPGSSNGSGISSPRSQTPIPC